MVDLHIALFYTGQTNSPTALKKKLYVKMGPDFIIFLESIFSLLGLYSPMYPRVVETM